MKACHVLLLFVALLFVTRTQAQLSEERLRQLRRIISNTTLANLPGGDAAIAGAIREVRGADGCDPNICFAIDGSRQLGRRDFELQLDFLAIIVSIVGADPRAHFAGTQYGLRNRPIRAIRGNAEDFLFDLEDVRYLRSRRSFIGGGVSYCFQQLNQRRGEPAKMVVFGDGRSSYGRLGGPLGPAALAADFRSRSPANVVCAVAVGFSRTDLFIDITQDADLVLKVTEWEKVLSILRALVRDICDAATPFRR